MARFNFRLKTLLATRESTRDALRLQLAEAQAAEDAVNAEHRRLAAVLRCQQDSLREVAAPGVLDVRDLLASSRYEATLRREIRALHDRASELAAESDRRREALVDADRDVRVLEKLREKQHQEFLREQARAEVKELDEIGTQLCNLDGHASERGTL